MVAAETGEGAELTAVETLETWPLTVENAASLSAGSTRRRVESLSTVVVVTPVAAGWGEGGAGPKLAGVNGGQSDGASRPCGRGREGASL